MCYFNFMYVITNYFIWLYSNMLLFRKNWSSIYFIITNNTCYLWAFFVFGCSFVELELAFSLITFWISIFLLFIFLGKQPCIKYNKNFFYYRIKPGVIHEKDSFTRLWSYHSRGWIWSFQLYGEKLDINPLIEINCLTHIFW